jgi:tetratricopeptide (TPR) repeat protein
MSQSELIRADDVDGSLVAQFARHGPDIWQRLLRSLPLDQADALRQQLQAFAYELELAELDDADDARRLRLFDAHDVPDAAPPQAGIDAHVRRGIERLQNGDCRQAILHFTRGLQIDPTRADIYAQRGDAHRLLGDAQRALADYDLALERQPEGLVPLLGKAAALFELGDFENARSSASAALALSERQPLAFRTRAAAAIELGDLDAALEDLNAVLDLDPDDLESLQRRGQVLAKLDEPERAVRDFSRILDDDPHNVAALLHRAHARRSLEDYFRAIRDYSEVLRQHAGNALAYTSRGLCHELNGDRESALADYSQALALEPDNIQVYLNRAKLYRVLGDLALASADLDEVLQRQSDHFAALYHRGKIALANAQWEQANVDLDAVVALRPDLAIAHASRAVIRERANQFAEARADADQAILLDPASAVAHLVRGLISVHASDLDAALADLTEAIRLDDQIPLAYQERTLAWTLKGDNEKAFADVNSLIALEPGNAQAYAHRSMLYNLRGEVQPALVDYAHALQLDPRVFIVGWNQPLSEQARNQTAILLADAVDGLRFRRNYSSGPAALEWNIVVEKPRPAGRGDRIEKRIDESRPANPPEVKKPSPPLPSPPVLRGRGAGGEGAEPAENAAPPQGATNPLTPSLSPEAPGEREKSANRPGKPALEAPPKPKAPPPERSSSAAATLKKVAVVDEPAFVAIALDDSEPDQSDFESARPAPIERAPAVAATLKKASPVPRTDVIARVDEPTPTISAFAKNVDLAIEALLSDDIALEKTPPPAPTPAKSVEPVKPLPPRAANAAPIDCPLCRHRLPPAETLSGGRFRCGNCNAVFFPGTGLPPAASFPAAAAKTRPVKLAAKSRRDDDEAPTWAQKWKRPTPLAVTGVAALALLYWILPSNLFGNGSHYAVHSVKGEATFDGRPIPNASIILYPINPKADDHPRPKAVVGPSGTFTLGTYSADDGAPAGEYKVSIVWNAPPTPREIQEDRYKPRNQLPPRYANPETSGLTARIEAGDNTLPAFALRKN